MRAAIVQPETREREERKLAELQSELEKARSARAEAAAETRRLNRIALVRPHLAVLEEAEGWLEVNADAPALPTGLDEALAAARRGVGLARVRHEDSEQALEQAKEAADRVDRDPSCSRMAPKLAKLAGMLGEAENKGEHIVARRAAHAAEMESVRAGLRAIGSDIPDHKVDDIIPTVGLRADVQAAITKEAKLHTAVDLARTGVAKAMAELAKAEGELTATEPLPDGLPALLLEIRADRNPVTHAEETEAASIAEAAEVRRLLASMPGWTRTAEELRAVSLLPEAEFQRLDAARLAAVREAEEARKRLAGIEAQDGNARSELARLREVELPDTASVLAARVERDRGMRLVLARAFGVVPSPAEEAVFAGDEPMPLAYERRVRQADGLADRRATELERVQEAERLG